MCCGLASSINNAEQKETRPSPTCKISAGSDGSSFPVKWFLSATGKRLHAESRFGLNGWMKFTSDCLKFRTEKLKPCQP